MLMYSCELLMLSIPLYIDRVGKELEENLGDIHTVKGAVKIVHSDALVSLSFLRSLQMIDTPTQISLIYER